MVLSCFVSDVGSVYDSITQSYFWVVADTAGGNLFVTTSMENVALQPILEGRNNPFALSLDWIGRNLYWVEGVSLKLLVRLSERRVGMKRRGKTEVAKKRLKNKEKETGKERERVKKKRLRKREEERNNERERKGQWMKIAKLRKKRWN